MPILVLTEVLRTTNSTEEFLGSIYLPFPNATFVCPLATPIYHKPIDSLILTAIVRIQSL
jgi:hypothetical protein